MFRRSTAGRNLALHLVAVCVPLVVFLLLATPALDRPGLHYDEALEAGLPAVQLLTGRPITTVSGGVLELGAWRIPLMVQNHIGAVQIYAALPFVLLGGPTAESLRTMTVLSGALTLLGLYLFMAQVYGRLAACSSALWLAGFASFVFWSRQGVFITSLAPCFAVWALASGAYWWRTRRVGVAALTGLLAGLAIFSKLSALWLFNGVIAWGILSLLMTAVAARRAASAQEPTPLSEPASGDSSVLRFAVRQPVAGRRAGPIRPYLVALGGLLLGCAPVLLYNLRTGGTLRVVQLNATETYLGANNVDVLGNLVTRLAQAADVLRSGEHLWYLGGPFPNSIALASVLLALLVLLADTLVRRGRGWRTTLFIPFLALAVIAQSCYTISALWPTHFAVATFLPAILFGVAIARLAAGVGGRGAGIRDLSSVVRGLRYRPSFVPLRALRGSAIRRLALVILVLLVTLSQVQTSVRYLEAVQQTGGLSFHSSAIYDVSRFLDGRTEHVVALDWGIAAPIEYLTGGRVPVEEFYGYTQEATPEFGAALRERLGRNELYVTHAEHQEAFQRRAAFLGAVAEAGMRAEPINVSIRADGWPMLEVWQVVPDP